MNLQINPLNIKWDHPAPILLFNPQHPETQVFLDAAQRLPELKSHVWIASSGRTGLKLAALSKDALLHSAQSVNRHLQVGPKDRLGLCLPVFHVGGLSILARGHVSGAQVSRLKARWQPRRFLEFLKNKKITFVSLVPSQVYDLVQARLKGPRGLRGVIVGGGSLSGKLYQLGRGLHWPLLPSYGLTECASQAATAELSSLKKTAFPALKILSHIQLKIRPPGQHKLKGVKTSGREGEIGLCSPSLLTGFMPLTGPKAWQFQNPKIKGWYWTQDTGKKTKTFLKITGHMTRVIKILGQKVSLPVLEEKLMRLRLKYRLPGECALLPIPSGRAGAVIGLAVQAPPLVFKKAVDEFNKGGLSCEKIRTVYFVPSFPQSSLLKPLYKDLFKILQLTEKENLPPLSRSFKIRF